MNKGSFLSNLQAGAYRRVTFSDGNKFGRYYDLEPPEAPAPMAEMGLDTPLRLPVGSL